MDYSVQFWDDNGNPLQLPFVNSPAGSFAGALAVGGTAFAETPGTASALIRGLGECGEQRAHRGIDDLPAKRPGEARFGGDCHRGSVGQPRVLTF